MSATQEKCRRIGEWLFCLSLLGLAVFIALSVYEVYTLRTSPKFPDARHSIAWFEHGECRYLTPAQDKLCSRAPIAGAEALVVNFVAVLLLNGCRFNVTIRFKKNRK
jgi:hypothetical protein